VIKKAQNPKLKGGRGPTIHHLTTRPIERQNLKNTLLPLLWRNDPDFDAENIAFGHVGKKSAAHKKALAVYHGKAEADTILKADDLLRQIIGR